MITEQSVRINRAVMFPLANPPIAGVSSSHTIGESMEKVRPFVRVPLDIAKELNQSELGFAVQFLALWWKRGEPIALDYSMRELADEFAINSETVVRMMKRLNEKGMIERMKGKGNRSSYSPTEKLTGKSIYIMYSCEFELEAVRTYAKSKRIPNFEHWLPLFVAAAKKHNVSTEETFSVVDTIAKNGHTVRKRSNYIDSAFRNIVAQRTSGASPSNQPEQSTPKRTTRATSEVESLRTIVHHVNSNLPITRDMFPRTLLERWDQKEFLRYDAERDIYFKRSDEVFFYFTTNDSMVRAAHVADLETILNQPFVGTSGVHAPA